MSLSAPKPPTSFLFGGVTNTSLEITWSGPVDSDYDDFDLQWSPGDQLSVINPYHSRTSGSRILRGMFPGRLYTFSLRTISGATVAGDTTTYSDPILNSIRTSGWQHILQTYDVIFVSYQRFLLTLKSKVKIKLCLYGTSHMEKAVQRWMIKTK